MPEEDPPANGGITNQGPVYTAAQHGPGYVGAMGPNSRGTVNVNSGQPLLEAELRELVTQLRQLLDQHSGEVVDPDEAREAIDELAEQVDADVQPGRIKQITRRIIKFTNPVQAFVEIVDKVLAIVDRFKT